MAEGDSIEMSVEEMLGIGKPKQTPQPAPAAPAAPPPAPTTAAQQAVPGTTPPAGQPAKIAPVQIGTVIDRDGVKQVSSEQTTTVAMLDDNADFEKNLNILLVKTLEVAQHDRKMAIELAKVHLDRATHLDGLPLSMPVASVIADNNGSTLKAMELAAKAGERILKVAELYVNAQRNADAALLATMKIQAEKKKGENEGWGDTSDIPAPPQ